jgi:SAM-dependent methyltransferase
MSLVETIHGKHVFQRRARILSQLFAKLIPADASVLDVGCGEGSIDSLIMNCRPDVKISGADVLVRNETHIPVTLLDGEKLPFADASFDVVLLVDVLHHSEDPMALLTEVTRVTRRTILLKDHLCEGFWDRQILELMDWLGNSRHGVGLLSNYWARQQWDEAFAKLALTPLQWRERLGLYPRPAGWIFDRDLHFLTRLEKRA